MTAVLGLARRGTRHAVLVPLPGGAGLDASAGPVVAAAAPEGAWPVQGGRTLGELARSMNAPASLVWERGRRGQRFEAMLLTNGSILLADGTAYTDPDQAATIVCGASSTVDGWRRWRLGADGPTLGEALGR